MCSVCCEYGFWFLVSGLWFSDRTFKPETRNQKPETMTRVYALQHLAAEPLGIIGEALEAVGIDAEYVRLFAGEPVPDNMRDVAGLVVMGGSMSVYEQDQYPFLAHEIRLIEATLKAEKPVLGICLGSQLLATALGASVMKGDWKEIGWFPVTLTEAAAGDPVFHGLDRTFTAYHWHGDVFELPAGATALASSAQTQCQAFAYEERAYGLLFHLEATQKIVEDMVLGFKSELDDERIDGVEIVTQAREHLDEHQRIGASVFQRWASLVRQTEVVGCSVA
jgi:GMP synthase (glutamine-hydrolysing)